jgi:hypothetical protein
MTPEEVCKRVKELAIEIVGMCTPAEQVAYTNDLVSMLPEKDQEFFFDNLPDTPVEQYALAYTLMETANL